MERKVLFPCSPEESALSSGEDALSSPEEAIFSPEEAIGSPMCSFLWRGEENIYIFVHIYEIIAVRISIFDSREIF